MDSGVMEEVLKEILQQQKAIGEASEREQEARQQIFIKLESFDQKLETLKVPAAGDSSTVLTPIKRWIEEVKALVEGQPKTVVHERRIQLFPDRTEEYYKLIFGSFFKALVILIIGIYALVITNRYIREQEYLQYKKAWQNLYNSQNEEGKQFLEKVMNDSEKEYNSTGEKVVAKGKEAL